MANNRNAAQRALAVLMAVLLLLSVSSVLAPITVSAASLTVTNGGDDGPGSLRALLASASDGDTVNFAPGVTAVTLTSGPIGFSQSNFTIDGGTGVTIRRDSTTNFTLLQSWAPITSTLTLKGLTLENGYTTAYTGGNLAVQGNANLMNCSFNDAGYGGAVYVGRNAELTNCDFDNNKATSYGGALYVGYSAKLTNCHFSNNQSTNYGGALYVADLASNGVSELTDCSFVGNQTTGSQIYGGAVYFTGASKVTRCVFTNNKATREGGGLHGYGSTELTGCSFSGNEATRGGGGAVLFGVSTLLGCTFTNNSAGTYFGGGADVAGAAKLTNCIFNGNTAGSGGGLYVSEYGAAASYAVLTGCVFAGNQARYNGAAVVAGAASTLLAIANSTISGNITSANGGAIANGERSYLFHTTITKNQGGGYYTDGTRPAYIYNSILAGNTDAAGTTLRQYNDNGNTCRFFNSLIEGEDGVTYQKIFGVNAFDSATSTHKVLGNGIAVGISESITTGDVYGLSGLNTAQQALISGAVTALANDQVGAARPGTGRTCGAVEATANTLTGVAVTTQPTKASYTVGEALVLAGTQLTLTYSNGATEVIDYNEPGVTNDAAANITATVGGKTIKFTFLGVDTAPTAGANITVTGGTPPIAPGITGPTTMSLQTGYAATFTGAYSVTGTAPVSVSKISGNLAITWNATE
ncbi:MAG: bacterial Ig-like domain-containing protein, partial [Firmicutes bacterium]|nr:bacterial Ig-like domain-containing protein [Bacillota bacterium]